MGSLFKSIRCRQFIHLLVDRQFIEYYIIDSILLQQDDKKGNEQRLATRRQYFASLDVNGQIIDYAEEFNERLKAENLNHHKSHSSDFGGIKPQTSQDWNDDQFDHGNISDDE